MHKHTLNLVAALAALVSQAAYAEEPPTIRQWAKEAFASSQWHDEGGWNAGQATGKPDVEKGGDDDSAWMPKTQDGGIEWLELVYSLAVPPRQVRVRETCGPGAVVKIEAYDYRDTPLALGPLPKDHQGRWVVLWQGKDPTTEVPGVLNPPLKRPRIVTNRLRITLDNNTPGWNEIDAVELVGLGPGVPVAAAGPTLTVGGKAEVFWGGQWWECTVLALDGQKTRVHYVGHDDGWDEWVPPERIRLVAGPDAGGEPVVPQPPHVGDGPWRAVGAKVQVQWGGHWWDCTILAIDGDRSKVHYNFYDDSADEWADLARVRPIRTPPAAWLTVGAKVQVKWDEEWFAATVLAVEPDGTRIHYDEYGDEWDEKVGPERIRQVPKPAETPAPGG